MDTIEEFEKWGLTFSGCDGGDIGTPENPSTWVCGIEWGAGQDPESLRSDISNTSQSPPPGYENWSENIEYIFNRQAMKLLSAVNGGNVSDYKEFARNIQPFVVGKASYFKMNLYPISFKDTGHDKWEEEFSTISGFEKKADYLQWCAEKRFPVLRGWVSRFKPKLIICFGKTYADDFAISFYDPDKNFIHEVIDDKDLKWGVNRDGSLIVVLPFMVNPNGLNKNESIQKFGNRISELLTSQSTG
jgi:hypothetical protein